MTRRENLAALCADGVGRFTIVLRLREIRISVQRINVYINGN